jgi:hypothetical protein
MMVLTRTFIDKKKNGAEKEEKNKRKITNLDALWRQQRGRAGAP